MLRLVEIRWLVVAGCQLIAAVAGAASLDASAPLRRLPAVVRSEPTVMPADFTEMASSVNDWHDRGAVDVPQENPWQIGEIWIRPYGFFWADLNYATQRTSPGAYHLYVLSKEEDDEDALTIDGRRTRFGLEMQGPDLDLFHGAASGGRLEIDFHGNFVTENRASVLLRHAYWEVSDETFRILVGQTWDVVSPLQPGMLDYAVAYFAGNIGFRRTQFRGERRLAVTDRLRLMWEGSLNQDIVTDFQAEPGVEPESSNWPVIEGRMAASLDAAASDTGPAVVGVSGHIGETGFDFLNAGPPPLNLPPTQGARFTTWSLNVDIHLPITERAGVQGELFLGANLSAYLGGVGQGVCPCTRVPIRSIGGWLEAWYDWTPQLHSRVGLGIDDPRNNDILFGRSYNHVIYANLVLDLSDNLSTGIEVTSRKTLYTETRAGLIPPDQLAPSSPGDTVTIQWMVRYGY